MKCTIESKIFSNILTLRSIISVCNSAVQFRLAWWRHSLLIDFNSDFSNKGQLCVKVPQEVALSLKFTSRETFEKVIHYGCRVIYFSGKGDKRYIILENDKGKAVQVSRSSMRAMLASNSARLSIIHVATSPSTSTGLHIQFFKDADCFDWIKL